MQLLAYLFLRPTFQAGLKNSVICGPYKRLGHFLRGYSTLVSAMVSGRSSSSLSTTIAP